MINNIKELRDITSRKFLSGTPAWQLIPEFTLTVDSIVNGVWKKSGMASLKEYSLVAVGGYGRAELHLYSDIDILILTDKLIEQPARELEHFITSLWDIGLEVSHSVRSAQQCLEIATADITVATSLMESRLLTGSQQQFDNLQDITDPTNCWPCNKFFAAKVEEQQQRHNNFNGTAYNLEPNIKEGLGGLRDIQNIGWIAKRHFGAENLHDLVIHNFLNEDEYHRLISAQRLLWDIRFSLHSHCKRGEERLLFEYQQQLAMQQIENQRKHPVKHRGAGGKEYDNFQQVMNLISFPTVEDNLVSTELSPVKVLNSVLTNQQLSNQEAVEEFMHRYFRAVREVYGLNEMLLSLFAETILNPNASQKSIKLNPRFKIINNQLATISSNIFIEQPAALLEMFLLLAKNPEIDGVRAATIRQVHNSVNNFKPDPKHPSIFIELLRQPQGITHSLRRMHRYGVLAAYLPIFAKVEGLMQYDLFHAYTVDEHTILVIRNLRRLTIEQYSSELPLASSLMQSNKNHMVLIVAALLHDIAKGQGEDHSQLGAEYAKQFATDHKLSQHDKNLIVWLVANHLLMSTTAQRKDISDPDVVANFSCQIGSQERLDALYILTVADIRATNNTLWNSWKDALLQDLYFATKEALYRGLENSPAAEEIMSDNKAELIRRMQLLSFSTSSIDSILNDLPNNYFLRHSIGEMSWHIQEVLQHRSKQQILIRIRNSQDSKQRLISSQIMVYSDAHNDLFTHTVASLDQSGLDIINAKIITTNDKKTLNTYTILEHDGSVIIEPRRQQEIIEILYNNLSEIKPDTTSHYQYRKPTRHQKHFKIATQVLFSKGSESSLDSNKKECTTVEVVATDRSGLLAKIGQAISENKIKIHNARIASFGERTEDLFQVTTMQDKLLNQQQLRKLQDSIIKKIDS